MRHNIVIELPQDLTLLPTGWEYIPLGCLVDESRGICYGIVQPGSDSEDGIPIIRVNNIREGRISVNDVLRVSPNIERKYVRSRLLGGEVLLTLVGSLGESAIVPPELAGWNVARAVGVIPVNEKIGARWVELCLRTNSIQHLIRTWATTTVQATFNLRDLAQLPIPIPPVTERSAIAHILGTLDDKIELNRKMNETLEAMAQAIFKSWFVDFDPVRAKAEGRDPGLPKHIADLFPSEFVDSDLGEIPKGWEVSGLDEIALFLNGLALQKFPPDGDDSLPVIKIAQLRAGHTLGADRASTKIPPDYAVNDGDVLFSWSGSLECELWTGEKGALNQHLFKVTSTKFPKWFYYFWIHEHLHNFRHIAAGKATTMGHIQRHHLTDAKAIVSSNLDLYKKVNLLEIMVAQLIQQRIESRTLAKLRDTLLPKLISGELRVKDAERIVGRHI